MTDRTPEQERAAMVAWLRDEAVRISRAECETPNDHMVKCGMIAQTMMAATAIERGEHLRDGGE